MNYFTYETAFGDITLEENGGAVTFLEFGAVERAGERKRSPLLDETARQLGEYFAGARKVFDVKVLAEGTPFQKRVWKALTEIPYGETRSYGELAAAIGAPKACRAVGGANNKNPVGIIIPCHRVIGANGKLVGYAGGVDKKEKLLNLERRYK